MADPMHQFEIQKIAGLPELAFTLPGVGVIDMSITNSTIAMLLAATLVVVFLAVTTSKAAVVPGRLQVIGEGVFGYIDDLVAGIIGHEGRKFFPFVFALFMFILAMNMLGLFLVFTATSQLAVTASLAVMTILLVVGYGILRKVFAGFVVSLGAMAAGGGLGLLGIPGAALSLGGVVALTALEFLVAFLQAFVFAVLACVYLNDVVNLGHHH